MQEFIRILANRPLYAEFSSRMRGKRNGSLEKSAAAYGKIARLREVVRRITYFRSSERSDPLYYARLTAKKAQADMGPESL